MVHSKDTKRGVCYSQERMSTVLRCMGVCHDRDQYNHYSLDHFHSTPYFDMLVAGDTELKSPLTLLQIR